MEPVKILAGTMLTAVGVRYSWVGPTNELLTVLISLGGVFVAWLTAWYTWEKICELHEKRLEDARKRELEDEAE